MPALRLLYLLFIACTLVSGGTVPLAQRPDEAIIAYIADPQKQDIQLYWKDDSSQLIGNFERLNHYLVGKQQQLVFATNGGMYMEDRRPVGLFIQRQKSIRGINKAKAEGNFYMQPNGVFYITTDKKASLCTTADFKSSPTIDYATQSGPMLVVDGKINSAFKEGSINYNVRNGVGLLPGNKLLFAMSRGGINFYDFAKYFQQQGCTHALYLDGFVSRTWLPAQNILQTDGYFGVMIGITTQSRSAKPAAR
ncbi:phosphodiester glycosidase family protein [Paraflavitalea pollutisoli]|uniref:phosphodiester glycosidase family protein n=1 Tax=Paraflavitalea pollutisoli TaxID=3034143 RepID=UPI0023EAE2EB|nr:phosphodiester glycosidase family protein [Paraflavitalea sp. H1-2-19X]